MPNYATHDGLRIPADTEEDAEWKKRAACRGMPTSLFYPENHKGSKEALKVCEGCQVRPQCLAYAARLERSIGWRSGIWGGTTAEKRKGRAATGLADV